MKGFKRRLDNALPIYVKLPKGKELAVWNCGFRPQSLLDAIIDTRITIRKDGICLFVIKKGEYSKIGKKRTYRRIEKRNKAYENNQNSTTNS